MPLVRKISTPQELKNKPKGKPSALSKIVPIHQWAGCKDKVLIYGASGTGKTTVACSYTKPILLIGSEDGTRSVSNIPGVDFVKLSHSEGINELVQKIKDKESSESMQGKPYQTVVLDTLTMLQSMVITELMGWDDIPVQIEWGQVPLDMYRERAVLLKNYVQKLLNLAEKQLCHVVLLAQESVLADDETLIDIISPVITADVSKSVRTYLEPACDYLLNTFIKNKQVIKKSKVKRNGKVITQETKSEVPGQVDFCLRTRPHKTYRIKFRETGKGGNLPEYIIDPTYEKILKLIEGKTIDD